MTDLQKRNEIHDLLAFLKTYVQIYVDNSFTDLTFDVERLITNYLNVFEKPDEKFVNVNAIQHNYPAVDLVSAKKGIAVQVTTNADKRKVDKTIATYNKHSLSYKQLIVIGFVKATKLKIPNVSVHGIEYLTNLAKFANSNQLDDLYDILKRQVPWNSLSPLDDKHCFDVVFDTINRSAIRDYTLCEGSFDQMADRLYQVKELITTGKVKGESIRAKALVEYNDNVRRKLHEIEFLISHILQICNANRNKRKSNFLDLSRQETDEIDDLKEKIINNTNSLAKELDLNKAIVGSRRH
ncbi:hypothetical protein DC498_25355 [Terrimonas sp.]|uniref:SMEK domain-containing protein n=1 Tax=Terrimonas sp. TaxID=1914338 RepID=UPI000D5248C4|nr:SMEK domain-containing protein [Terrimonas sp.]PVD49367.1 hypothetical protein DC498_25355 [Terrimonas sp.]